jgi:hypothetical protein
MPPADDITIPRRHYDPLIEAANLVATVGANLVETVLTGSPYEDMLRNPIAALREALANVPGATTWDGIWRDTDTVAEVYRHEAQPRNMPDIGVKVTHIPTGLSAESYIKHTVQANETAAMKGLRAIVERRAREIAP